MQIASEKRPGLAGPGRVLMDALEGTHNTRNTAQLSTAAKWLSRRFALSPHVAEVIAVAAGIGGEQ